MEEIKNQGSPKMDECLPKREKYWSELTPDEKIERMREQVKIEQARVRTMIQTLTDLRNNFVLHSHHDGKILLLLNYGPQSFSPGLEFYGDGSVSSKDSGKVYF